MEGAHCHPKVAEMPSQKFITDARSFIKGDLARVMSRVKQTDQTNELIDKIIIQVDHIR